jgi:hypothetical protein
MNAAEVVRVEELVGEVEDEKKFLEHGFSDKSQMASSRLFQCTNMAIIMICIHSFCTNHAEYYANFMNLYPCSNLLL